MSRSANNKCPCSYTVLRFHHHAHTFTVISVSNTILLCCMNSARLTHYSLLSDYSLAIIILHRPPPNKFPALKSTCSKPHSPPLQINRLLLIGPCPQIPIGPSLSCLIQMAWFVCCWWWFPLCKSPAHRVDTPLP